MSPPQAAPGPITWTTREPSTATGARLADDRGTLVLDAQVPSGEHPCVRDLRAVLTGPVQGTVLVQITFSSPAMDRRSGCTGETIDGAKPPALRMRGPRIRLWATALHQEKRKQTSSDAPPHATCGLLTLHQNVRQEGFTCVAHASWYRS
ncbi:hypothetical protein GCM10022284_28100 [Streptomyces hundungensis]